jgi:hypothetical protein
MRGRDTTLKIFVGAYLIIILSNICIINVSDNGGTRTTSAIVVGVFCVLLNITISTLIDINLKKNK